MTTTPQPTRTRFARRGVAIQTREKNVNKDDENSSKILNNNAKQNAVQDAVQNIVQNTERNAKSEIEQKTMESAKQSTNKVIINRSNQGNDSQPSSQFLSAGMKSGSHRLFRGTFPSPKSTPPLISTGSSSLDSILLTPNHSSTAVPLTSFIVVKSDPNTNYAHHLLRYFASEGFANNQGGLHCAWGGLLSAFDYTREKRDRSSNTSTTSNNSNNNSDTSENLEASDTVRTTPSGKSIDNTSSTKQEKSRSENEDNFVEDHNVEDMEKLIEEKKGELKIAWQYRDLVEKQIKRNVRFHESSYSVQSVHCNDFDLSKPMQERYLEQVRDQLQIYNLEDGVILESLENDVMAQLKKSSKLMKSQEDENTQTENAVKRIILEHFGGQMYICNETRDDERDRRLLQFLHKTKYFLRQSASVCFITIPSTGISSALEEAIYSLADLVMDIYSFTGSNVDVSHSYELASYTGMLNIKKLPHFNTLSAHFFPDILSYVFKLKRRKMYIEKLHLPPEETREAADPNRKKFDDKPKGILKVRSTSQSTEIGAGDDSKSNPTKNASGIFMKETKFVDKEEKRNPKRSVGFASPLGGIDKKDLEF